MSQQNSGEQVWMFPAAMGGILAAVALRNKNAISLMLAKDGAGTATRHAAKMHNVAKPVGRVHTNVSAPIGYNISNQLGPYKSVIKNPIQAGKSIVKDEPIWMNPAIQKEYLRDWRKRVNKERKALGRGPINMSDEEIIKRMNERQPIHRPSFWLDTQESLKGFDSTYRKNKAGYSFNRSDPTGKAKYDEVVNIVKRRDATNTKQGYHSVMGGFKDDLYIDGKRMYEDVWDVALNPNEVKTRKDMWKQLWHNVKTGKPNMNDNKFNQHLPNLTVKERIDESKDLLIQLARLESRNLYSKITDPVTLRGVINEKDLL